MIRRRPGERRPVAQTQSDVPLPTCPSTRGLDLKVDLNLRVLADGGESAGIGCCLPRSIIDGRQRTWTGGLQVEFGPHKVDVPEGGYYDRFRMNPDLDEVARSRGGEHRFFRRIRSVRSRRGSAWAPNFYRSSSIQLLFRTARTPADHAAGAARAAALPGYGLVALTFFSYSVCDNDPYDEVSVAVVIRRPGATGSHALGCSIRCGAGASSRTCSRCRSPRKSRGCAACTAISCPSGSPIST